MSLLHGCWPSSVQRVAADGDLVFLHVHGKAAPGDPGLAIVDIFRVDPALGRIVEHWDVMLCWGSRPKKGYPGGIERRFPKREKDNPMRMTSLARAAAIAACLCGSVAAVHAADGGPQIKFSGYGTVAGVFTDDGDREFNGDVTRSKGAKNKLDIGQDSRFGLQSVVDFQQGLSATGQVVAKRRLTQATAGADKDFDIAVEWLYGQYQLLPSVNVRLGRMALPAYLLSDSLNVGYAATWLRAPAHFYTSLAFTSVDGVQLNYRQSLGDFNLSAQATRGKSSTFITTAVGVNPLDTDDNTALSFTLEHGNWLGRLGYLRATVPVAAFAAKFTDSYVSAGLQYDDGSLIAMSEVARRSQNGQALFGGGPFAKGEFGYVAVGWRFGKLVPMAMLSHGKTDNYDFAHFTPGQNIRAVQTHTAPSLSLRYDVAPNVALKAQVDRYAADDGQLFTPVATDSHKVTVMSVGFDFVF